MSSFRYPFLYTLPSGLSCSHSYSLYYTEIYKRARILITLSWLPPTPAAAPKLELIQFCSAGVNHVAQHPIYTDSKIPLASASGVHGPQIAEWVMMMNLINSHGYIGWYEKQKERKWGSWEHNSVRDMVGQRVGVLGYGSIGRQGQFCPVQARLFYLFCAAPWSTATVSSSFSAVCLALGLVQLALEKGVRTETSMQCLEHFSLRSFHKHRSTARTVGGAKIQKWCCSQIPWGATFTRI